jgi:dihydrofolate synthase / folylpolyglutamate synthase
MRIEAVTAFLYALKPRGIRFGLENTRLVLERLGRPQRSFRVVHVAGSNGKGSTCAFLEALLRRAGLRVGLFTSPHLIHYRERFRVDGRDAGDDELGELMDRLLVEGLEVPVAEVLAWLESSDSERRMEAASWYRERGEASQFTRLTFFECTTILAAMLFERAGVDVAIMEVGMGGRLDATNVLDPSVCAIVPIHLEHTAWLGSTLAAIAGEKAGIIKPGVPVVVSRQAPEAEAVFERVAAEQGAPLVRLGRDLEGSGTWRAARFRVAGQELGPFELGLAGAHQVDNAAVALGCLPFLGPPCWPLPAAEVGEALGAVVWAGRVERFREPGSERTWILDGAHNPDGVKTLCAVLPDVLAGGPYRLVFGVLGDKQVDGMLPPLLAGAAEVVLVQPEDARGRDPRSFAPLLSRPPRLLGSVAQALERLAAEPGPPVVATGSLTVVGEARRWLLARGARPARWVGNDGESPG